MAELADAMDSKSIVRKGVWVQVPLRALAFDEDEMKQSMVERKLKENSDELKRAREEFRISVEQLEHFEAESEEARLRSMVSETPLATQEYREAARHTEKMRNHHGELQARIEALEVRQDALLDEMMNS